MTGTHDRDIKLDPLKREAVVWVRRLTSGQATAADAEALQRWYGQSAAHAAAFLTASRLWKDLEPAGRNVRRRENAASLARSRHEHAAISRRALFGGGLAGATVAAAYFVVHPPLGLWPSWSELTADYRTGTGEQRSVSLSRDVSIRMNTQTSIVVQSSDLNVDRLELISGEASFSTTSRSGRAFAVHAGDIWITANGAQFEVRYLQEPAERSVCVTCLRGELSVARENETTTVGSRQQLRYAGGRLERSDAVDPEVVSAWQRGVLIFRFTPLADVVDEINRYRPGRILVINAQIGRIPVSGRFRIDKMDEILTQLELAFGAKVRSLPGGLVLLS